MRYPGKLQVKKFGHSKLLPQTNLGKVDYLAELDHSRKMFFLFFAIFFDPEPHFPTKFIDHPNQSLKAVSLQRIYDIPWSPPGLPGDSPGAL